MMDRSAAKQAAASIARPGGGVGGGAVVVGSGSDDEDENTGGFPLSVRLRVRLMPARVCLCDVRGSVVWMCVLCMRMSVRDGLRV